MNTKIFHISLENPEIEKLKNAASYIKDNKLVAFPTETVYGLGANALNEMAVRKIFEVKGRPPDNPLIVHVSSIEMAKRFIKNDIDEFSRLTELLWPGPITLIFNKESIIPDIVSGGLSTIAIRYPAHPIAQKLIELSGVPIAAPSANISGKPSPTNEEHVTNDLKGRVECLVLSGRTVFGLESTIVDLSKEKPNLLRPGPISVERLKELLPEMTIHSSVKGEEARTPLAPGMKYKHYSPEIEMILYDGELDWAIHNIIDETKKMKVKYTILCSEETQKLYPDPSKTVILGSRKELYSVAANLFDVLLSLTKNDYEVALCEPFPETGIGLAIMNRLRKASWKTVKR
ncbi:MAG: L-threonylcarbamoyladenylate synthase [Thermotogota bacterium]|nr:L-threonylcarbamoyladenylate synthase [Thermotogota bacterium]